jgi:small-conductance mechanosensitive channel
MGSCSLAICIQQDINLKIKERFEKEEIEFAYPTQSIFIEK